MSVPVTRRGPFAAAALLLLIILVFNLFSSCTLKFRSWKGKLRDYPDLVLSDFRYISADNAGRREFEIKASDALMYNSKDEVYLYNLTMTFFNENNSIKSFLSANSGYINKKTMNVFAEGKVQILSDNETTLMANKVFWENDRKQFYSEPTEKVTIKKGNSIITGYKMVADEGLKEISLESFGAGITN